MTTPERPSLADTLARIDAVLDAYYDPTTDTREVDVVTRITSIVDHAAKPCLRCARQALRGSEFCAAHKRIPREMIEELGPVTRDGKPAPFPVPARPYLKPALEAAKPNPPATEPGPGWLARALRRLFT